MSFGFLPGQALKPLSRIMFDKYDTDEDGCISTSELSFLCYDRGYPMTAEEVAAAMAKLDTDGNGTLSYDEFLNWWRTDSRFAMLQLSEAQQKVVANIVEIFKRFDADRNGWLDMTEFARCHAELLREGLMKEPVERVIDTMDRNSDRQIMLTEFLWWFITKGALDQCAP